MPGGPQPTTWTLLSVLPKARVLEVGREFGLAAQTAATKAALIEVLATSGKVRFQDVLGALARDELKAACRAHGLDDSGRDRATFHSRLRLAHVAAARGRGAASRRRAAVAGGLRVRGQREVEAHDVVGLPRPPNLFPSFANPSDWRTPDDLDVLGPAWRRLRGTILRRDSNTCLFCGFQADGAMIVHHLDGNHAHHDERNLCSVCPACNLVIHAGFGSVVAKVVDFYRESRLDQVEVVRRTLQLRAQGLSDERIVRSLGLARPARFRMDRRYLRSLTAFVTDRVPVVRHVADGLRMMLRIAQAQRAGVQEWRARQIESERKPAPVEARKVPRPYMATGILRSTFQLVRGVGPATEERMWRAGQHSWDHLLAGAGYGSHRPGLVDAVRAADAAGADGSWEPLSLLHSKGLDWRMFPDLREHVLYLDVETTGLNCHRDDVTLIATFDGRDFRFFTRGENLDEFGDFLRRFSMIVTFGGSGCDIPFLRHALSLPVSQPTWDVRTSLYRLGVRGDLQAVEQAVQLQRSRDVLDLDGFDATMLWDAHLHGDRDALPILRKYASEDVASLPVLAALAFNRLAAATPLNIPTVPVPPRPSSGLRCNARRIRDLLSYRFAGDRALEVRVLRSARVGLGRTRQPSTELNAFWIMEASKRCRLKSMAVGKWLIFVNRKKVDEVWRSIVENIRRGDLGRLSLGAKVSTARPTPNAINPREHVICVYSPDSDDIQLVMRIRHVLRGIGVTKKIPYKTDDATTAGLYRVAGNTGIARWMA